MKVTTLQTPSGKKFEFVDAVEPTPPVLVIGVFAAYGSGKSRFGVTGPDVCGIIPTDRKTRRTVENTIEWYRQRGVEKKILMPKIDFVRQVNPMELSRMDEAQSMEHYRKHVDQIKEATWALHSSKDVNCIMIDLFSQFYQDVCWAHYGRDSKTKKIGDKTIKDKSDANQEVIDFINSLATKHLILTCKNKDEYHKNTRTGRETWEGFKFMGNHVNVMIELETNPAWNPELNGDGGEENWRFGCNLRNAQDRIDIPQDQQILTDDMITFGNLASYLYPEFDWED